MKTTIEWARAVLEEMIINTNMDIGAIEEEWVNMFVDKFDYDLLGEVWIDVMSELPELN
jgi:hypothetical protein